MPPRLFVDQPLRQGSEFSLPSGPARHVQVLRLQPGAALTLFNGNGGEWSASVLHMGRANVQVRVAEHHPLEREMALAVTLALGMPANERMDTLVEKATELGVATIQPLVCQRSVLRLSGERAHKKVAHWQGVAVAACEQSGRTRVPHIAPVLVFDDWLARLGPVARDVGASAAGGASADADADAAADAPALRLILSFAGSATGLRVSAGAVLCLSGPEGGLTEAEEAAAIAAGFAPTTLGPRVLRADTAPLALLAHMALAAPHSSSGTR